LLGERLEGFQPDLKEWDGKGGGKKIATRTSTGSAAVKRESGTLFACRLGGGKGCVVVDKGRERGVGYLKTD